MQARGIGDQTRIRELKKLRADLGPPVLATLEDRHTIEMVLNPDDRLWQEKLDELMQEIGRMEPWQAEALIRTVAAILKVVVTRENPIGEGELTDGSRFAGQLLPIVTPPRFAIRKRASEVYTLEQYADAGIMTPGELAVVREGGAGEVQPIVIHIERASGSRRVHELLEVNGVGLSAVG